MREEAIFQQPKPKQPEAEKNKTKYLEDKIKFLEEALKKEQQKSECLDNIIAAMPGHVYWLDRNNVFLGCNDLQAEHAKLKSRYEIIGKTNYELPWKDQADELVRLNNLVMKTGELHSEEEQAVMSNGFGTYLSQKKPLKNNKGELIGVLGISVDISDRKRAEQLAKEKNAKEKEIVSEKLALTEAFAGFLAHEMRTPIAALNLDLDTIAGNEKNQNEEEKRNNLYEIIAKGKQTIKEANVFIDMLLLKLRSMGKKVKEEEELNPCLILEDVSDALALYPFTEAERVQVILDEKDAFVYLGDSLHTQHIILNLLKNALKIIREEGRGEISIRFEQNEAYNKLIFTDTAKGIAQEFLPNIFDAFITKDVTKKGTGLGLAYCKLIMHGYGGNITCESKLGEYTRFILTFPKVNIADMD